MLNKLKSSIFATVSCPLIQLSFTFERFFDRHDSAMVRFKGWTEGMKFRLIDFAVFNHTTNQSAIRKMALMGRIESKPNSLTSRQRSKEIFGGI